MSAQLSERVAAILTRALPEFRELLACTQLSAGASQETWRIEFETPAGKSRLALRRTQPTAVENGGVGGVTLETEARLFQLAVSGGIPGPEIVYVLQPGDAIGSGFFMQWLEGETLGHRIVRSENLEGIRPALARQCGEILGRIHALDWRGAGLDASLPVTTPGSLVDETWAYYRDLDVPMPVIDYCWRWLREHLPTDYRLTLVHGDFRNGNLMVTQGGINAVLDWELAHIGDPVRDLGWLCVNSWRFGNSAQPVGGFGAVEELLAGYHASSGIAVSRESLRFWQVFGSFWWAVVTLQMAHSWRTGETPSLERPVIGRRSSEAQMDCVNLLMPGEFSLPEAQSSLAVGTRLPMPAELLEGVTRFLKQEVANQLDPHSSFLARVAANSLQIAQREFQYGAAVEADEQQRLKQVLNRDAGLDELRRELVLRLRDDLPLDTPGLTAHLRQTTAGQLFIDQPHYSALTPVNTNRENADA